MPLHSAGWVGRTRIWGRVNPRALHDSAITTEFRFPNDRFGFKKACGQRQSLLRFAIGYVRRTLISLFWYTFCVISFIVVFLYHKRIHFTWIIHSYSEHTSRKNCFATAKKSWKKGYSIYSLNDVFLSRWLEEKYR